MRQTCSPTRTRRLKRCILRSLFLKRMFCYPDSRVNGTLSGFGDQIHWFVVDRRRIHVKDKRFQKYSYSCGRSLRPSFDGSGQIFERTNFFFYLCKPFTRNCANSVTDCSTVCHSIKRFSYDPEMKTREQNRNNKRTEIERFDGFIERIQTRAGFWLVKRTLG